MDPHTQTSRLLLLPGELRNRIYTYLIAALPATNHPLPYYMPQTTQDLQTTGALLHTSTQLRREYLPLYLEHTTASLRPPTANKYISTFFPLLEKAISEAKLLNSCFFRVENPVDLSHVKANIAINVYTGFELDITLLLNLLSRAPNIQCCITNLPQKMWAVNDLVKRCSNGKFQLDFVRLVKSVRVRHTVSCARLDICLFDHVPLQEVVRPGRDGGKWLVEMGAPNLRGFSLCVRAGDQQWHGRGDRTKYEDGK